MFSGDAGLLSQLTVQVSLPERVRLSQSSDAEYLGLVERVRAGRRPELTVDEQGVILCGTRLWVPASGGLRSEILQEAHFAGYSIHPGSSKMYQDRSTPDDTAPVCSSSFEPEASGSRPGSPESDSFSSGGVFGV